MKDNPAAAGGETPAPERWTLEECRRFVLEATLRQYGITVESREPPLILPRRPPRKMPTLWTIASYWCAREDNPLLLDPEDLEDPLCFGCENIALRCDLEAPTPKARWNSAAGSLDRAHLIDRARGGLDGPQNIIPLCYRCHRRMPMFIPGQEAEVIAWVLSLGTRIEYPPPRPAVADPAA